MQGRAKQSPLGAERSDGPHRPPLEAAPAKAMTAAEPLQRSMQWHRVLTRGSCPSGAIADRKASSAAPPLSEPVPHPCAAAKKRFGRSCGWLTLAKPQPCRGCAPCSPSQTAVFAARAQAAHRLASSQVCPEWSEAQCRDADVGPPFFAYFLWWGAQRQDAGRKDHCGKSHRKAHCHQLRRKPHTNHPASHATCSPERHLKHIKKDSKP